MATHQATDVSEVEQQPQADELTQESDEPGLISVRQEENGEFHLVFGHSSVFEELCSTYDEERRSGSPEPSCSHPDRRDRVTALAAIRKLKNEDAYLTGDEKQSALSKFGRFHAWLQGYLSSAKVKTETEASKSVYSVARFHKFCGFSRNPEDCVVDLEKINEWLQHVKTLGVGPSSAHTLTNNLLAYVGWLEQTATTNDRRELFNRTSQVLCRISKSLNFERNAQKVWRRAEEEEKDWKSVVDQYQECCRRAMAKAELLLKKHHHGTAAYTTEQLVFLRRTLMLSMVVQNTVRQSAIFSLTWEEARRARWDGDELVIKVAEHKAARTMGSVEMRLARDPAALFFFLRTADTDQNGPFFSQNSHGMSTSLSIELKKLSASLNLPPLPSATQLHKATHTLASVESRRDREALTGQLNHSLTTAARHNRCLTNEDRTGAQRMREPVLGKQVASSRPEGSAPDDGFAFTSTSAPSSVISTPCSSTDVEDSSLQVDRAAFNQAWQPSLVNRTCTLSDKSVCSSPKPAHLNTQATPLSSSSFMSTPSPSNKGLSPVVRIHRIPLPGHVRPSSAGRQSVSPRSRSPVQPCSDPAVPSSGSRQVHEKQETIQGRFSLAEEVVLRRLFGNWIREGVPRQNMSNIQRAISEEALLRGRSYRCVYFKLKRMHAAEKNS